MYFSSCCFLRFPASKKNMFYYRFGKLFPCFDWKCTSVTYQTSSMFARPKCLLPQWNHQEDGVRLQSGFLYYNKTPTIFWKKKYERKWQRSFCPIYYIITYIVFIVSFVKCYIMIMYMHNILHWLNCNSIPQTLKFVTNERFNLKEISVLLMLPLNVDRTLTRACIFALSVRAGCCETLNRKYRW